MKKGRKKKRSKEELRDCDLRTLLKAQGCVRVCVFPPCTAARISFKQMRINEYGRHVAGQTQSWLTDFFGGGLRGVWRGQLQIVLQPSPRA